MKPTIKDIASRAGVSITAVSLILNDKPNRISEDIKQKVKEIAKELNYVPNYSARNLITKETKTIGVMIPDIENPFFSEFVKAVESYLKPFGYTIMISNSDDKYNQDIENIENFINRGVDGILLTISNETYLYQNDLIKFLENTTVPYVLVDRVIDGIKCNKVHFNSELGGFLATEYAIANGRKKIACITVDNKSKNSFDRLNGYKKSLKRHNIKVNEQFIFHGEYRFKSGYELAEIILKNHDVDAIVACNDLAAYGVIKKAKELGIQIPNDLLVVGYDNLVYSKMFDIPLASIEQDVNQLSEKASKLLLSILNENNKMEEIVLTPILKIN